MIFKLQDPGAWAAVRALAAAWALLFGALFCGVLVDNLVFGWASGGDRLGLGWVVTCGIGGAGCAWTAWSAHRSLEAHYAEKDERCQHKRQRLDGDGE